MGGQRIREFLYLLIIVLWSVFRALPYCLDAGDILAFLLMWFLMACLLAWRFWRIILAIVRKDQAGAVDITFGLELFILSLMICIPSGPFKWQFSDGAEYVFSREGVANCTQQYCLFPDQEYTYVSSCFGSSIRRGKYYIVHDSIYFHADDFDEKEEHIRAAKIHSRNGKLEGICLRPDRPSANSNACLYLGSKSLNSR